MSNGTSRKPNNSINTFSLGAGATYHFSPQLPPILIRHVEADAKDSEKSRLPKYHYMLHRIKT